MNGKGSKKKLEVGWFLVGKSDVQKFLFKWERAERSWKVSPKLESLAVV